MHDKQNREYLFYESLFAFHDTGLCFYKQEVSMDSSENITQNHSQARQNHYGDVNKMVFLSIEIKKGPCGVPQNKKDSDLMNRKTFKNNNNSQFTKIYTITNSNLKKDIQ